MRTIELMIDAVSLHMLRKQTDPAQVQEAVGYLSTWNMTFPHVTITASIDQLELVACYYCEKPAPSPVDGQRPRPDYVIGAVWHAPTSEADAGHFSFHS